MRLRSLAAALWLLAVANSCGSGSEPDFRPQVLYRLTSDQQVTLRFVSISSGRSVHTLPADKRDITIDAETFTFLLANAPPPFVGVFEWISGSGEVEIEAIEIQGTETQQRRLSADEPLAVVELRRNAGNPATEPSGQQIRFELCSPLTSDSDCTDAIAGRPFSATIGDAEISHLITAELRTPAVIFLERAQDNVSGIFRGIGDQLLRAEMFIDGDSTEVEVGRDDLVLSEDL
ncbi:MAG TPA: hypothetical protein VEB21_04270 [Terriglobales bacterium]|nr:hypothetical protein [Terriglobales bacterium]